MAASDSTSIQKTTKDLGEWLMKADKSGPPGKFRAWIYQHAILPRVLWPLLVYEVPNSGDNAAEEEQQLSLQMAWSAPQLQERAIVWQ